MPGNVNGLANKQIVHGSCEENLADAIVVDKKALPEGLTNIARPCIVIAVHQ